MLDRRPRGRARAAVVTRDHHVIALTLGNPCGNRAHTNLRHQLHADGGMRGHVFKVMDQLRQILNGVDVVVRWRRDQTHARHAVAQFADVLRDLATRQLTAFTRLGTLGHFDLNLIG